MKKSTQFYLSSSTRGYALYDDAAWALTNAIVMRLPADYILGTQHMFSNNYIPQLLESSGFHDSYNLVEINIELWRESLTCWKNIYLPLNERYCYQSNFIKYFNWRMLIFKASLKTGYLYLFDMYSNALIGIILPLKRRPNHG